nr:MAG TPA_asm: hypothetical protein [Caudoviricetes sp.]
MIAITTKYQHISSNLFPQNPLFLYKTFKSEGLNALYPIPLLHVYHVGQS